MGKGDFARDKQFLLFPQCFQKACFPEASKGVCVWEWVNQGIKPKLTAFPKGGSYICIVPRNMAVEPLFEKKKQKKYRPGSSSMDWTWAKTFAIGPNSVAHRISVTL